MSKNKKYSNEFKLMVVKEYQNGKGSYKTLVDKHDVSCNSLIVKWVNQYKTFGEWSLFRARTKQEYPLELRLITLELHETIEMSMQEIVSELSIKNPS